MAAGSAEAAAAEEMEAEGSEEADWAETGSVAAG